MTDCDLRLKQKQFNAAMELYEEKAAYKRIGKLVSTVNVALQIFLLFQVIRIPLDLPAMISALLLAFLVTDFVNGLVHMYMDNNDSYESFAGPFIANFHLHHKKPMYKRKPLLLVYFDETGSKVWLIGYLLLVALLLETPWHTPFLLHLLLYVGILSSVAEVSHYLCHTSTSPVVTFLGGIGLLLNKRHHARHHMSDNANYAFLNGWTDPLLNAIAATAYPGYKSTTDRHFALYEGAGSDNR